MQYSSGDKLDQYNASHPDDSGMSDRPQDQMKAKQNQHKSMQNMHMDKCIWRLLILFDMM